MKITVIGTGYLGAVHAASMAKIGHEVLGVDSNPDRVAALSAGKPPFFEPGLDELLTETLATGRLRFCDSLSEAAAFGDVHFVCVGTPQSATSNAADLRYVRGVVSELAPLLTRPCTVIGKSTVPVGTADLLAEILHSTAPAGEAIRLVWNPEFLREGFAIADTLEPDRIVVGSAFPGDDDVMRELYEPMLAGGTPFISTDFATAELVKVAANAFLATKISFINAMAEVCEATGADVTRLAEAIGHDDRIGSKFLRAGLGFGGGCLPKDIRAFMARAGELRVDQALTFLREVDEINLRRRRHAVDLARVCLNGNLANHRIACLGAAFKPNSDDVRDSPALDVAAALQVEGANVRVYDPKAAEAGARDFPTLAFAPSLDNALERADLVMVLTEWDEFRAMDPARVAGLVARPAIIDARNCLDPQAWRDAGWHYRGFGRP